ncbi:MAG TPA: hypothetical protein VF060_09925 [Trebonia sp.]
MRASLSQGLHYNDNRSAFGSRLSRLPIQGRCWPTSRWSGRARPTWGSGSPGPRIPGTTSPSGWSAGWGPGYGTLRGVDFEAIIDYARLG